MKNTKKENKELVKRYPFLLPRNVWTDKIPEDYDYSYTLFDEVPDMWRKKFGKQMLEELREILIEGNYLKQYRVLQIKEKYGCYDEETEVLTKKGWKFFKDLTKLDEIATLDSDMETLIYETPKDIISEEYNGKMYFLENRGVSLLVTPNHKLYVSKGSYYNGSKNNEKRTYDYRLVTPDVFFGKDKRFKKGCSWIGVTPPDVFNIQGYKYSNFMALRNCIRHYTQKDLNFEIMAFLRFLGFYVAEGHSYIRKTQGSEISIAYNPYDEEELVTKLISDLGFPIRSGGNGLKRIGNKTLALWLKENCGHLAPNKKVPEFIKELPPLYIEEFLKYLFIGDGHKTKTYNILTTTSKQLSNDVQELLLKAGYTFRETCRKPHINKSGHRIQPKLKAYDINWLKLKEVEIENSKVSKIKSFKEEWINYSGKVYCVTVPNHVVYVRRNGKGCWCGNSLRWYTGAIPVSIWDKHNAWENKYSDLSESTCFFCGADSEDFTSGWILPACKECLAKPYNERKVMSDD